MQTKQEAVAMARLWLKNMPGGWRVRVWENLGWHWELVNSSGRARVHPCGGKFVGFLTKDGGIGSPINWPRGRSMNTPIEALRVVLADTILCLLQEEATVKSCKEEFSELLGSLPLSLKRKVSQHNA